MKRGVNRALVPSVRTDCPSIGQMHTDVSCRVFQLLRSVLLARPLVCFTHPDMSQPDIKSCFKPSPQTPLKASAVTRDRRTIEEKSLDFNVTHARLILQWALPRRVIFKKKGCPSYDAGWVEGLHQVACLVASGKIREPPAIAIQLACPDLFRIDGFSSSCVVKHFEDLKMESSAFVGVLPRSR